MQHIQIAYATHEPHMLIFSLRECLEIGITVMLNFSCIHHTSHSDSFVPWVSFSEVQCCGINDVSWPVILFVSLSWCNVTQCDARAFQTATLTLRHKHKLTTPEAWLVMWQLTHLMNGCSLHGDKKTAVWVLESGLCAVYSWRGLPK